MLNMTNGIQILLRSIPLLPARMLENSATEMVLAVAGAEKGPFFLFPHKYCTAHRSPVQGNPCLEHQGRTQ